MKNGEWYISISLSSQSDDLESQAFTDGGNLQTFSVKERVSFSTECASDVMILTNWVPVEIGPLLVKKQELKHVRKQREVESRECRMKRWYDDKQW